MMDGLDITEELQSEGVYVRNVLVPLLGKMGTSCLTSDWCVCLIANQAFEADEAIESDHSENSEGESGKKSLVQYCCET